MSAVAKSVRILAVLAFCAAMQSCGAPTGPPQGVYKVDTVSFVPNPRSTSADPAPGVWIDTNTKLSSLSGGDLKSQLPYGVGIDYTDNNAIFQDAEFTRVTITYDDGAVDEAANQLQLPLRIPARQTETVNSVSGGRIVRSTVSVISDKIPDIISRAEPFTLQMSGHFTRTDGSQQPFEVEQHFDVEKVKATKDAAEVLQDK